MGKAKVIPYSQAQLKELVTYVPETGEFFWNELPEGHTYHKMSAKNWNTQFAGKAVGGAPSKDMKGYAVLKLYICGKFYKAHRVAWKWMTGEEPPEKIDHKNRNSLDNCWKNLRDASEFENAWNRSKNSNNKSGYTGVTKTPYGKWVAYTTHNGTQYYLGTFSCKHEAAEIVKEKRDELGFDEGHGQEIANYRKTPHKPKPKNYSTGIKNISYIRTIGKYRPRIKVGEKRVTVGEFNTLEEACLALLEFKKENGLPIEDMQISSKHGDIFNA